MRTISINRARSSSNNSIFDFDYNLNSYAISFGGVANISSKLQLNAGFSISNFKKNKI